jgi:mRNA interferase HigB
MSVGSGRRAGAEGRAVHIISRKKLKEFSALHPDADTALESWYRLVRRAEWRNFADLRRDYASADQVGTHTVFNIGGNKFRLIAVVMYEAQRVYVRFVLTHREYDRNAWKADKPKPRPKTPKAPKKREDT